MTAILSSPIVEPNAYLLQPGEEGVIVGFTRQELAASLMAMGVLPGSKIRYVRRAPFGGAFYLAIDHHFLALRQTEFEAIVIRK
ncbi:MAG: FeoA family protein [Lewinella sp.]|jgi:Fe2+ transport system protein FeoA|uniref:FeoA family protein n=1 Tax=Lewinella sp. TaxID=2004506 RepID=UPI003D6A41BC